MSLCVRAFLFSLLVIFLHTVSFGRVPERPKEGKPNTKIDKAEQFLELANRYLNVQDDSAKYYAEKAIEYANETSDVSTIIVAYSVIAEVHQKNRQLQKSIKIYLKAIKLAESNDEITKLGRLYNGLGICYYHLNNFKKTEYYIKKAASAKLASKDYTYYSLIQFNLSSMYIQNNRVDDAFKILFNAEDVLIENQQRKYLAHIYNSLGACYELTRPDSDSAHFYYQKSLSVAREFNEHEIAAVSAHNIGKLYLGKRQFTKGLEYLNVAESHIHKLANNRYTEQIYATLSEAYDSLGDYRNAYRYKTMQFDIHQEIYNVESNKALEELEIKYQSQKKEAKIQRQQKKLERTIKQRNTSIFIAVIILVIISFAVFSLFQFRKVKRILELEKLRWFENVVHEIRTPLTLISAPIQLLKEKYPESDENIVLLENNTMRLTKLVNELLDVSKVKKGLYQLEYQYGSVSAFIENLVSAYRPQAERKKIDIKLSFSDEMSLCSFPTNALEKILSNLIGNAIKYSPKKSTVHVHVHVEMKASNLYVEVSDNGNGIPKREQSKIFNRFYRGKKSMQTTGTGIGLSMVSEILELLGGTIKLDSKLNVGSTFSVTLPVNIVDNLAQNENLDPNKPTLLLVEDDDDISALCATILKENFNVVRAENGFVASEFVQHTLPDIILSDLMMPLKDGIELLKEIKSEKLSAHIPVVLFSARNSLESKLEGLSFGADAYIPKPFSPDELKMVTQNLLTTIQNNRNQYTEGIASEKSFEERIKSQDEYVNLVIEKVIANMDDPEFSVNELADQMFVSRSQLHRKLVSLTGLSTTNFIRMIRLEKAKDMLVQREYNITQIAYSCGFTSQSYFTKSFTEYFKTSPSAYLKSSES